MYEEKGMFSLIPFPQDDSGTLDASYLLVIKVLIEIMKQEKSWKRGELNTMVLYKEPDKKIVLTVVHEGTQVTSYQANDSIGFHVIEGKLKLRIRNGSVIIGSGERIELNEKTEYSFDSLEETAFLLTVSSGRLHFQEVNYQRKKAKMTLV